MKVLILFAHPAFHKSRVNKVFIDGLSKLDGITFHDLYEEYPELDIDAKREQQLLSEHDVIVFQFPLFWYSTPAILKEWQDLVLSHGWAFGSQGNELKDKYFFCTISTGGPRAAYKVGGYHNHTLNQLLSPIMQTARLCKMKTLPPYVIHGSHIIEKPEILKHRSDYFNFLNDIVSNSIDIDGVGSFEYINDFIKEEGQQDGR
jgi:glutathione-regulated potassium-efflux system ancillary protein KefG